MAIIDKNLSVDLVVVEATKIEGEHIGVGTVLKKVDAETAFELTSAGKVRLYSKELESDMKARAKAEAAAAEARAAQQAAGVVVGPAVDYAAIIKQAVAEGIAQGVAALTATVEATPAPAAE